MTRIRTLTLAAVALVMGASAVQAQIPGSFSPTPTANVTLQAQKAEAFAMTLSSTVQVGPLSINDSTAGAGQTYTGSVVLTPTWDLANNRQVTIYGYVSTQFSTGVVTFANSLLEGSATGGTGSADGSWNPFSSTVDGHASAVSLTTVTATGANKKVTGASESITVGLRINTTNTYIEPGLYTGVVTFGARVQ